MTPKECIDIYIKEGLSGLTDRMMKEQLEELKNAINELQKAIDEVKRLEELNATLHTVIRESLPAVVATRNLYEKWLYVKEQRSVGLPSPDQMELVNKMFTNFEQELEGGEACTMN